MAKAPSKSAKVIVTKHSNGGSAEVQLPTFSENLLLIRKTGRPSPEKLKANESAYSLLKKVALSRPGISHGMIFHSRVGKRVDAYSVDPTDPTKIVRERQDGSRAIGRLVHGQFRILPGE